MNAYPHLTSPWSLAGQPIRNRLMAAAISTVFPSGGGVTDRLTDFYANRARGGAGLLVTEALLCHRAQSAATRVQAFNEANLEGLKRWAGAVEAHDSRLLGQLYDPGRGRHHPGRSEAAIGASARPDDLSWTVPRALTRAEIGSLVAEMAETSHRLQRAGFSGVEVSCGHGHLFHQFLSPQSNRRDDEYGGDATGRTRFVREVCEAVRAACGEGFIVGLKLAGSDGVSGGIGEAEAERIVPLLVGGGRVDYLAFVQGAHHRSLEAHMPDRSYPPVPYREMTTHLRPFAAGLPVVAVARITQAVEAEALLAAGDCEAVMLGRALLADAAWLDKAASGHEEDTRLCISCNTCWGTITQMQPIICDVNPTLGTPDEVSCVPKLADHRRKLVIVGAGLAGLEAAWIAAERGHDVTLIGSSDEAGGAMRINASIPGCEQLARTYHYQLRRAHAAGVVFRLGVTADAEMIAALAPDEVVLATGSVMLRPDVLDASSGALDLREAVRSVVQSPERGKGVAVIFDQDHTAGTYDALQYFSERFAHAVLLTPREAIATEVALVVRQRIQTRIYGRRIPVVPFAELVDFSRGTVRYRDINTGDIQSIEDVAMLAYSTPRIPADALAAQLTARDLKATRIGDCVTARSTAAAVREGHDVALAL